MFCGECGHGLEEEAPSEDHAAGGDAGGAVRAAAGTADYGMFIYIYGKGRAFEEALSCISPPLQHVFGNESTAVDVHAYIGFHFKYNGLPASVL